MKLNKESVMERQLKKSPNIWRLNTILLCNRQRKKRNFKRNEKYIEINKNENTT